MKITPRITTLIVNAPVAWGFLLPVRGCPGAPPRARVPPRGARFLVDIVVVLVRSRACLVAGFSVLRVGLFSYGGVEVFWWL